MPSPWHGQTVHYYVELLEHSDQECRQGACLALGQLKVRLEQLKHKAFLLAIDWSLCCLSLSPSLPGQEYSVTATLRV